jgi:septum formation protein
MSIILASGSPRRRELLEQTGLVFEVMVSPAEEIHDAAIQPERLCEMNATLKAEAVAVLRSDAAVIGADTLVFIDGEPLGKPVDLADARSMLRRLSGRVHRVCTGVCVIFPGGEKRVFHDLTEVTFLSLDEESIEAYLQVADPLDKAGAYGIQESGDLIIQGIFGNYDNVMGLPVEMVLNALAVESGCEISRNGR